MLIYQRLWAILYLSMHFPIPSHRGDEEWEIRLREPNQKNKRRKFP